jgi:site-specific recombinase XerD
MIAHMGCALNTINRRYCMTELRSKFIAHLELKNYSKSTVRNYVQVVKQFSEFIGHSPVKLTQDEIRNYLLHLKRVKKLEPKTINLHLYAIKSFCQFMLPETDIMRPFTRMREPNNSRKCSAAKKLRNFWPVQTIHGGAGNVRWVSWRSLPLYLL